ncbi:amino acid ABC transporter permease [Acidisoma cellulosilytica]|uniref:Amino acid ABC transporter permease n=1 Tax=Acidisoma cellulosilyticum TaxID=2802395 RepID=A0A963YYI5_9PROT|nr:amino acid ABC transporter permease [Acidisoma cellulosilyticum]MCB8878667.1 amino acid ABC transporter permease [Acidisoma cellulosilyticum]
MTGDLAILGHYLPQLIGGVVTTIGLWVAAAILSIVIGMAIALARSFGGPVVNLPLALCVQLIRGTPFLVQVFLLYFGGPALGLSLDPIPAGLIALALFGGCYLSEVFRAGIRAVPPGHVEAAACVGMTRLQTFRRIVLPEMFVMVLPPSVNIIIGLLKDTAILSVISVPELTGAVQQIGSETFAFVLSLGLLSLSYWALVELCAHAGRAAERRLSTFRFVS